MYRQKKSDVSIGNESINHRKLFAASQEGNLAIKEERSIFFSLKLFRADNTVQFLMVVVRWAGQTSTTVSLHMVE